MLTEGALRSPLERSGDARNKSIHPTCVAELVLLICKHWDIRAVIVYGKYTCTLDLQKGIQKINVKIQNI